MSERFTEGAKEGQRSGHDPARHLGSLKPPIYETSTFVFESAEAGKRYYEAAYGTGSPAHGEDLGFSYSRIDSPNLRAAEATLAGLEGAGDALVFGSGMAAISTVLLTFLRPGELVLYSSPVYGGTSKLLTGLLAELGIEARPFRSGDGAEDIESILGGRDPALVYVETPANPTSDLFDLALASSVAEAADALLVVDNTFLSPVLQRPLSHGADLVVHSATKYLAGHSDLTAGAVCGRVEPMEPVRHNRYRLGTTASPRTAWLLARSLETLELRVRRQTESATAVAAFLADHPGVETVHHLSLLDSSDPRHRSYLDQCDGPGAMLAFEVAGGEAGAFAVMDGLKVVNNAVSLGGTESLVSHPWTTSHLSVDDDEKKRIGVTPGLIRLSVGIEDPDELIADLSQALS